MTIRLPVPLPVPWQTQHYPLPSDWPAATGLPEEGGEIWGHKSCGIACVRAALRFYGLPAPPLHELLREGLGAGAYSNQGWIHSGLARIAEYYDLHSSAMSFEHPEELQDLALQGVLSIVSCTYQFPQDGRRGGHLVVFTGEFDDMGHRWASFMDPSTWGSQHQSVPSARFWASTTGRAIVLRPKEGL